MSKTIVVTGVTGVQARKPNPTPFSRPEKKKRSAKKKKKDIMSLS